MDLYHHTCTTMVKCDHYLINNINILSSLMRCRGDVQESNPPVTGLVPHTLKILTFPEYQQPGVPMKVYQKLSELNIQTRYLWISVISYLESVVGMFVMPSHKKCSIISARQNLLSVLKQGPQKKLRLENSGIQRVSRMPSILIFVILILMVFSRIVLNL